MSLKDKIENNLTIWFLGALLAGFLSGIATYKGILEIAQLKVISAGKLEQLEKAQQKNTKEFPKKTTQPVVTKQNVVQSQQAVGVGGLFEVEEGKSTFFKLPNGDTESISVSKVWEMHGYLYTGFNGKRI